MKQFKTEIDKNFLFAQETSRVLKKITGINIFENSRKQHIIEVRSLFVYIMRTVEYMTYYNIRDFFENNGKAYDHTTAMHAYNNYSMYSNYNKKLDEYYNLILQSTKSINSRKLLAKALIDSEKPEMAEIFTYMYKKSLTKIKNNEKNK